MSWRTAPPSSPRSAPSTSSWPSSEDTPLELITRLQPDVLFKGADYTVETVVGADVVLARGGRVELLDLVPGRSTS
jgi:D-beta-D-heptose 7-phosphate kinase/D-beta-D-heptose 1-phosphate adenosyltransferase